MQYISADLIAEQLGAYLHHQLQLPELIDWAEQAMMEGDFDEKNIETLVEVTARLGAADIKAFGLTWEDCEYFLDRLGYRVRIEMEKCTA